MNFSRIKGDSPIWRVWRRLACDGKGAECLHFLRIPPASPWDCGGCGLVSLPGLRNSVFSRSGCRCACVRPKKRRDSKAFTRNTARTAESKSRSDRRNIPLSWSRTLDYSLRSTFANSSKRPTGITQKTTESKAKKQNKKNASIYRFKKKKHFLRYGNTSSILR